MPILKNKRILITGASHGLGAVCAKELSCQGARLALAARSADELDKVRRSCVAPKRHICLPADLTEAGELQAMVEEAKNFLGGLDVVLHVAGGGLGLKDNLISADDLLKLFKLNLMVAAGINSMVVPDMVKRKKGNLVHVGSIASQEATGSVGYNTVKAALAAYVRTLGRELAGSGVVVTGILPGGFLAPGNSWERLRRASPEAVKKFIKERLPRGFLAQAGEFIPLISLLCSEKASAMCGCMVPVDAGEGRAYLA